MEAAYGARRYREACGLLPEALGAAALALPEARQAGAEELRLRIGRPLAVTLPEGEVPLAGPAVTGADLERVVDRATAHSPYAAGETIRQGFVTAEGGFRVGLCGTALPEGGENRGLRDLTSLAIRIPRACPGTAEPLLGELRQGDRVLSALILSPPGGGKTTLLRDLIRRLSDGVGHRPLRVGVADERGEVAGLWDGVPQLDVGGRTDVMDGCPKGTALLMLLRGMNPQVLAADEITDPQDCAALLTAANCGVGLLCTAHAAGLEDLRTRPMYRPLLEGRCFRRLVVLASAPSGRRYQVSGL